MTPHTSRMLPRISRIIVPIVGLALLLTGCSTPQAIENRAVVIVSGGGAVTPFTTPTEACATGMAAGNTDTALREYLLAKGKQVYTAPAMDDWGVVVEPDPSSFGAFGDCPTVLPEQMTIMSGGDINAGGEHLARFLTYLQEKFNVTDVDLIGHSNGGLFSRAAIRILTQTNSSLNFRSLTMMGTPNEGSFPTAYAAGEIGIDKCVNDPFCTEFNTMWLAYAGQADKGINNENTFKFLDGVNSTDGWNEAQAGFLDDIPVTMLAGTNWSNPDGDPKYWPFDGIVAKYSAWAEGVSDDVIPHRTCWSAPLTHSIFVSDFAKLDWQTALTWNKEALARVNQAIDEADTAMSGPNRQGCEAE